MKRSGFKPKLKPYARQERMPPVHSRLTVPVRYPVFGDVVAIPKEAPIRHEGYRRLVRMMSCAHCGITGFTQFCHSDENKGMSIKSTDLNGWPGCGPHFEESDLVQGCHALIGSTGSMTRDQRRALEATYARQTRETIIENGQWPADLPMWIES